MKKGNFSKLVLLSGALAFPAYAEKVQIEQLPSDLQERIRAEVGSAQIEDIDRQTKDGKTIYEVGYKKDGQHVESRFEHNESATAAASASPISQKIRYEELPDHIRRVASARLQGAEVNDVDRRIKDGRTTYEIGYKQSDGAPQQELLISEEGRVLNEGASSVASSSSTATSQRPAYNPSVRPRGNSAVSTRTVEYSELPSAVRSAAESRLREGHVSRVDRLIQNGQITYQIDFLKEDGRTQQLLVAENGGVLRDQILSSSAVGVPAAVQSGTSSSSTAASSNQAAQYANITTPVQLLNAQQINHSQLPVGVARVVRGYTSEANIDEIRRGSWRGQDAYQIGFTDRDNRYVQLQLDANGQVIYDPRRTAPASTTGNLINSIGRLFEN